MKTLASLYKALAKAYQRLQDGIQKSPPVAIIPAAFFAVTAGIIYAVGQLIVAHIQNARNVAILVQVIVYAFTAFTGLFCLLFMFMGALLGAQMLVGAVKLQRATSTARITVPLKEAAQRRAEIAEAERKEMEEQAGKERARTARGVWSKAADAIEGIPAQVLDQDILELAGNVISSRQPMLPAPASTSGTVVDVATGDRLYNRLRSHRRAATLKRWGTGVLVVACLLILLAAMAVSPLGRVAHVPAPCYILCQSQ